MEHFQFFDFSTRSHRVSLDFCQPLDTTRHKSTHFFVSCTFILVRSQHQTLHQDQAVKFTSKYGNGYIHIHICAGPQGKRIGNGKLHTHQHIISAGRKLSKEKAQRKRSKTGALHWTEEEIFSTLAVFFFYGSWMLLTLGWKDWDGLV